MWVKTKLAFLHKDDISHIFAPKVVVFGLKKPQFFKNKFVIK